MLSPELEGRVTLVKGFKGTEKNLNSARDIAMVLDRDAGATYQNLDIFKNTREPEAPSNSFKLGG